MPERPSRPSAVTLEDCRQAIRFAEREKLRLRAELLEKRAAVAEQRRAYREARRALARMRRTLREGDRRIEMIRELAGSGACGDGLDGAGIESVPAGLVLLERISEMMGGTNSADETELRAFFRRLADLQEFAKDFFDYAGVRLVYELGEILGQVQTVRNDQLRPLFKRVSELRAEAERWFERLP